MVFTGELTYHPYGFHWRAHMFILHAGSAPAGGTSLSGAPVDGGPQWNNLHWARGQMEFDAKAAVRERMRDYYLNM
jgi:hypothetical protein